MQLYKVSVIEKRRDKIPNEMCTNDDLGAAPTQQGSAGKHDILNAKIIDVVRLSNPSARLENVIRAASDDRQLPAITIADYLSLGDKAPQAFLNLRNCGRKTVEELDQIVKDYLEEEGTKLEELLSTNSDTEAVVAKKIKDVEKLLGQVTLPDELLKGDISVRLHNVLERRNLSVANLLDYVRNKNSVISAIRHGWGAGRKTVKEFQETCDGLLRENLQAAGIEEENFDAVLGVISGYKANRFLALPTPFLDLTEAQTEQIIEAPYEELSFHELVELTVEKLDERQRDVITRRYGLGCSPETLEGVAGNYGVTRERIRQIQATAIRRMGKTKPGRKLPDALNRDPDEIWSQLAGGQPAIKEYELSGYLRLAFDVVEESPVSWLDRHAVRWRNGWYWENETPDQLGITLHALSVELEVRPPPIPLKELDHLYVSGLLGSRLIQIQ